MENTLDRKLAHRLPGELLKDFYPRVMRKLAEHGLLVGAADIRTKYGFVIGSNRLDAIKWYLHYFGLFEPTISVAWTRLLKPGDVVLDIGGNIGYHAMLAATLIGPEGKVISFEPAKRIFDEQQRNISKNGFNNIVTVRAAVSDRVGTVSLSYAGENCQGNSSIVQVFGEGTSEEVESMSFNEIADIVPLADVKLIKIDVEGAEFLVIDGLRHHLAKLNNDVVVFVEISRENTGRAQHLIEVFKNAGFQARQIENRYDTHFYRHTPPVRFSEVRIIDNDVNDLVFCRNGSKFDEMSQDG